MRLCAAKVLHELRQRSLPAMSLCLIVQPIHQAGVDRLRAAGIEPRMASGAEMDVVALEIADAEAVITRSAGLSANAMDAAPRLRVVVSHGVGVDSIAIAHATRLGIAVVNTPGANRDAVAEHTFALMLGLAKRLTDADAATRVDDFAFKFRADLSDISGKRLGLIGFGGIARRVAEIARAGFRMDVSVLSATADPGEILAAGCRPADSLYALLAESDIVSLHRTLRPESRGMIGRRELATMKPTALLVNTARGALIDEAALAAALTDGVIAGAGLDVFEHESLPPGHPLIGCPNTLLTPHSAGSSEDTLRHTAERAADRVIGFLAGEAADLINTDVWPQRRHEARTGGRAVPTPPAGREGRDS